MASGKNCSDSATQTTQNWRLPRCECRTWRQSWALQQDTNTSYGWLWAGGHLPMSTCLESTGVPRASQSKRVDCQRSITTWTHSDPHMNTQCWRAIDIPVRSHPPSWPPANTDPCRKQWLPGFWLPLGISLQLKCSRRWHSPPPILIHASHAHTLCCDLIPYLVSWKHTPQCWRSTPICNHGEWWQSRCTVL